MNKLGDNLQKMEMFFDYDVRIKRLLMDTSPDNYVLDREHLQEYEDRLFKQLEEIKYYLYCIVSKFKGEYSCTEFEKFFKTVTDALTNAQGNPFLLERAYKKYVYDIREEFTRSTHSSYSGADPFSGWNVMAPLSINEYLHDLHMSICNDENFYRDIPEIKATKTTKGTVTLRGVESKNAIDIIDSIAKADFNCPWIEILSLSDRILIMARNIGHAISIEITFESGMAIINYFIPKVTHVGMVRALPGLNPVPDNATYATDVFEVPEENVAEKIADFLGKVPTDNHGSLPGGRYYIEEEPVHKIS